MTDTREWLKARRRELINELNQIDRALAAINAAPRARPTLIRREGAAKRMSLGAQALETIKDFPDGIRSRDLAAEIERRYHRNVNLNTLTWYLSQLKGNKKLKLKGEFWVPAGS